MPKLFIIFNPAARGEKSQRLRAFLESQAGPDVTLAPTSGPGDATRLAAEGQRTGHEVIVAAGGDGTINEVVNGLGFPCSVGAPFRARPVGEANGIAGRSPLPQQQAEEGRPVLGVLPLGTANVFARELGIPLRLEKAWTVLERGQTRVVDVGVAGQRKFVQLAGIGFDAAAVRAASWQLKKKLGPLAYVLAGFQTLRGPLPAVEVMVAGKVRARGVAVLVGNGRFFGGSFRLFPQARLDDGLLDVCVFERIGWLDLLRFGPGILSGRHIRQRGVQYFQAAELECRAAAPLELDGEDVGNTPMKFKVLSGALRVVVP